MPPPVSFSGSEASLRGFNRDKALRQGLVRPAAVVLGTVREEPVDDHADDGEQEDDQAPEKLVQRWAVGLEDLDFTGSSAKGVANKQRGSKSWEVG